MPHKKQILFLVRCMLLAAFCAAARNIEDEFNSKIFIRKLTRLGGGSDGISSILWNKDGSQLLVDRKKRNGCYGIEILDWEKLLNEEPTSSTPVSELRDGEYIRQTWNNSTPCWTADNRAILFSGQRAFSSNPARSGPFFGLDCHLWAADRTGKSFRRFRPQYPPDARILGETAPAVSSDGSQLAWTVITSPPRNGLYYGTRKLALAPLRSLPDSGLPRLGGPVLMPDLPGANDFIETYGFSRDGSRLYFAANLTRPDGSRPNWYDMDIYSWEYQKKDCRPVPLTQSSTWERFAVLSPQEKKIIWSSGRGYLQSPAGMQGGSWYRHLRTELWIMDADGKFPRQLTRFNDRNAPEYMGRRCYTGMSAWHPDGRHIAVVVNTESSHFNPESHLFILELEAGIRTPGGTVVPLKTLREQNARHKKRPTAH